MIDPDQFYKKPDEAVPRAATSRTGSLMTSTPGKAGLTDSLEARIYDPERAYADIKFKESFPGHAPRDVAEILFDVSATQEDANLLADEHRRHTANPPDQETIKQWQAETRQRLKEQYGADADQALRQAARLAARDPRTKRLMEGPARLGDNPRVVLMFARMARSEAGKGRL